MRPAHHPNQHTEEELKSIQNMWKKNKNVGLVVFWVKLKQRGYQRTISGLYHAMIRLEIYEKTKKPKKGKGKEIYPTNLSGRKSLNRY